MRLKLHPRRLAGHPAEWVVHDGPSRCPYLPNETARLPLRLPARRLTREELSAKLKEGDRRQGLFLYRPSCPSCSACEAIRIDVDAFRPSKTQRRILRRGDAELRLEIGRPSVSREKVALYNHHKVERGLQIGDDVIDLEAYEQFLVETCADTIELRYRHAGKLIGVAVADRASDALSAVYCYFDPAYGGLSPGAFSILKQIELCRHMSFPHLYLGLYVTGCRPMSYKAGFHPHERLIGGVWRRFRRGAAGAGPDSPSFEGR
jgi:arginyl-tRNA--protein-N-Asp/Glu arginylyltransferase